MWTPTQGAVLLRSDGFSVWRAPRLRVTANGDVLTAAVAAEVVSNNFYAADRFRVSISLGQEPWVNAQFWASETDISLDVQFSLDGGASFTSVVQGSIDSIVIDPILAMVYLEGRDRTADLIEGRTQETFANRTSSEIAALFAARHGLTAQVSSTTTPIGRYYKGEHDRTTLNQFSRSTTEWDLLVFLARQEAFDVFVEGQTLYFQPPAQDTSVSLVVRPSDVVDLRLERSLILARQIQVVVKSWNSRQNTAFVQQAQSSPLQASSNSTQPQSYVFVQPNLTSDQASKVAQQKLAELTRLEREIEFSIPGELKLTPRSLVALDGTGTDFDQTYHVDQIERRLSFDSGMTERVRARNTSPRGMA